MTDTIRVAIIGCGRISPRHVAAIQSLDGLQLASVCDIDPIKSSVYAEVANVPRYSNMHNMVQSIHPDLISVLTPSGLHATHVIELSRQYNIPIIVEKPIALTLADAYAMVHSCKQLFVVKQNRFNIPIIHLQSSLHKLGKLVSASVCVRWCRRQDYYNDWHGTWALSGGVLANQASHHIDLLRWMVGEPHSVFAYSTTALVDTEVEDLLVAVIKFKNGVLATVEVSTATRPKDTEGSLTITGERGMVKVGGFACNKIDTWQIEGEPTPDISTFSENPPDVYGFGHKAYYAHVRDCLLGKKPPPVTGEDAIKGLELTIAMYQSIEEHREVTLSDGIPHSTRLGQ